MTEINITNYHEHKFSRDTQVDYKNGDPVINCIFKKYDKDLNGEFDDKEWAEYQKSLEKSEQRQKETKAVNDNVIRHYDTKLKKLDNEYEKLSAEYDRANDSSFEELWAFEEKHGIYRDGYNKKSEIPKGAMTCDVAAFGMGIYDEKNECFTGECYKDGYILGLDKLTESERKNYLKLLKKAQNRSEKLLKLEEKEKSLDNEKDKYSALLDMSQNSMIDRVGSKEYEEEAYTKYVEIRSASNPFYEDIKKLETEIQKLRLKGKKTDDDVRLIEQYNIQLTQLKIASNQWTIRDAGENIEKVEGGQGFNVGEIGYKYTQTQDKSDNTTLNSEYSYNMGYSNENLDITSTGTIAKENKDNKRTVKDTTTLNGTLNGKYKRENTTYSAEVTAINNKTSNGVTSNDAKSSTYTPKLGFDYKNFSINLSEEISTVTENKLDYETGKMSEEETKRYSPKVEASYNVGIFENTASVTFNNLEKPFKIKSREDINYEVSTKTNNSLISGEKVSLNVTPSLTASYNDIKEDDDGNEDMSSMTSNDNVKKDSLTLTPDVNAELEAKFGGFNAKAILNDSYSCIFETDKETRHTNTLTLTGNLGYQYNKNDFRVGITCNESYSRTWTTDKRYKDTSTFTASCNMGYEKLTLAANYTNTSVSDSPRHTVGGELQYGDWGDAVKLSLKASHRSNKENTVTFGITVNPSKIYEQNHNKNLSKVKELSEKMN